MSLDGLSTNVVYQTSTAILQTTADNQDDSLVIKSEDGTTELLSFNTTDGSEAIESKKPLIMENGGTLSAGQTLTNSGNILGGTITGATLNNCVASGSYNGGTLHINKSGSIPTALSSSSLPTLLISSDTTPLLVFSENDEGADNKVWDIRSSGGSLLFNGWNDAFTTLGTVLELRRTGSTANGVVVTGDSSVNGHLVVNSGSSNTILSLRNTLESAGWDLVADADNVLKFSLSGTGTILQLEDDRVDVSKNVRVGSSFDNNNYKLYLHNSSSTNASMRIDTEKYGIYMDMLNNSDLNGYSFRSACPNSGQVTIGNYGYISIRQASVGGYGFAVDSQYAPTDGYAFSVVNATKPFKINNDSTIQLGNFDVDYSGNALDIVNNSSDRVKISNKATSETVCLQLSSKERTSGRAFGLVILSHNTAGYDNNGAYHIKCYSDTAVKFNVLPSGSCENATNSYGGFSDSKIKHTITDSSPQLDKLMNVRIVDYYLLPELDPSQTKMKGCVAQELEVNYPNLVQDNADMDTENNDLGTTTKSVKYSVFVPILIKALQEANQKVIDQQAQIDAQQVQIDDLLTRVIALESA